MNDHWLAHQWEQAARTAVSHVAEWEEDLTHPPLEHVSRVIYSARGRQAKHFSLPAEPLGWDDRVKLQDQVGTGFAFVAAQLRAQCKTWTERIELERALVRHLQTIQSTPDVSLSHSVMLEDVRTYSGPPPTFYTMPDGAQHLLPHVKFTKDKINGWTFGNHSDFTPEHNVKLQSLLREHRSAFAFTLADLKNPYNGADGDFKLRLKHKEPIVAPVRRKSLREQEILAVKGGELRDADIIEEVPSDNPYASETTCPSKKDENGNWVDSRLCMDLRPLNDATETDNYGFHTAEDLFTKIGMYSKRRMIYTKLDMRSGFHQIPVAVEDRHKLAFRWGSKLWAWKRMPFGAKNASAKFQRVMDTEIRLAGLEHCCVAYIDDVLIFSSSPEEHLQHVEAVLRMLEKVNLRAHPDKSIFATEVVEYIGHYISPMGISPQDVRTAAIRELKAPKSVSDLRSVLGFCNYYRQYAPHYSEIARPMLELTKKNQPWQWGQAQETAFEQIKDELCKNGKVLRYFDPSRPIHLFTDWSKNGISGVLSQTDADGNEYIVTCISRSLNNHERNYSSYEGELLAAVWAIKSLRFYLHGLHFKVVTDHHPLVTLMRSNTLVGKQARWALSLQEYEFEVLHRPGVKHANADFPSRYPRDSTADHTGARLDEDPAVAAQVALAHIIADAGPVTCSRLSVCLHSALQAPHMDARPLHSHVLSVESLLEPNLHELVSTADACMDLGGRAWLESYLIHVLQATPLLHHTPVNTARSASATDVPPGAYSIDTTPVDADFFHAAWLHTEADEPAQGIVMLELFGGICAGLEMALKGGAHIRRYFYVDNDPVVSKVAAQRIKDLHARYPQQLPLRAIKHTFLLPQDVRLIDEVALRRIHAHTNPSQHWLVVGGWECQDLSPAGRGRGLQGERSSTFYDLVRVVSLLQSMRTYTPLAYLIENVPLHLNFRSEAVRVHDNLQVQSVLGMPITVDAAQFGSRAHRLRSFWTNLADTAHLSTVLSLVQRPEGVLVNDVLDPHRTAQPILRNQRVPFYQCPLRVDPVTGYAPMPALPTFVSYYGSRAYRDGARGMVFDFQSSQWEEPNADEKERCMGYLTGTTVAPGVTELQRHDIIGRCMDGNTMFMLWGATSALALLQESAHKCRWWEELTSSNLVLVDKDSVEQPHLVLAASAQQPNEIFAQLADQIHERHVTIDSSSSHKDIWEDHHVMAYLKAELPVAAYADKEKKRILKRASLHEWKRGKLYRITAAGRRLEVPPPAEREAIILVTHEESGHFGVKRTISLLQNSFFWTGLYAQTAEVLKRCVACRKVEATFKHDSAELHPLPLEGLFYRVGVDLFGPLPDSQGYKYCMVMVEYFSKHIELAPLKSKTAKETAKAFLMHYIARFGACAEVVTDQGTEFKGEFQALLDKCLIDHRTTSANHPQADGLAERAVQTMKKAIRKYVDSQPANSWVQHLPWILLGYRASKQAASKMSPYFMLYGREAVIPPAIMQRWEQPLQFDESAQEEAARLVLERAELMKHNIAMAMDNLRIAQHRDTLRYAQVRSGAYRPKLRKFEVGDFVWVRTPTQNTLQTGVRSEVLRVKEVKPSSVLVLQGKCGGTTERHASQCAPCHLAGIDPTIDPLLARPAIDHPCQLCNFFDRPDMMLLCDHCGDGYHTDCLNLNKVPSGFWTCPKCREVGVTPQVVIDYRRRQGLLTEALDEQAARRVWSPR